MALPVNIPILYIADSTTASYPCDVTHFARYTMTAISTVVVVTKLSAKHAVIHEPIFYSSGSTNIMAIHIVFNSLNTIADISRYIGRAIMLSSMILF